MVVAQDGKAPAIEREGQRALAGAGVGAEEHRALGEDDRRRVERGSAEQRREIGRDTTQRGDIPRGEPRVPQRGASLARVRPEFGDAAKRDDAFVAAAAEVRPHAGRVASVPGRVSMVHWYAAGSAASAWIV